MRLAIIPYVASALGKQVPMKQTVQEGSAEAKLASYVGHQIRTHPSEVYGRGFVMALEAFQLYGLPALIQHVKKDREFPQLGGTTDILKLSNFGR
jgi:hypothetical protein